MSQLVSHSGSRVNVLESEVDITFRDFSGNPLLTSPITEVLFSKEHHHEGESVQHELWMTFHIQTITVTLLSLNKPAAIYKF